MFALILILVPTLLSSMEQDYCKLTLEPATLKKFVEHQQKLIAFSKKTNTYENNNLIKKIEEFAQNSDEIDKKIRTPDFQEKIKNLFYSVEYNKELVKVREQLDKSKNQQHAWESYRKAYEKLLQKELREKGVVFPAILDTKTYLWTNARLTPEATEYVIAGSVIAFYIRETQERITGRELDPLEIR